MNPVDREGTFRAEITEYGIREAESGSVGVTIRCKLTEWWDGQQWLDWSSYDVEALGDVWIVKKDGSLNEPAAQSLIRHAGWDGNIDAIANSVWQPTKCAVAIQREEYKGQVRFKIAFVNDWARTPGQLSSISADKARELATRYGGQLRAMAGSVQRNHAPTTGAPARPPAAKPVHSPAAPPPPPSVDSDHNNIPF